MIPVGVIGVGFLGRFHAQKYAAHPRAELVGIYDPDALQARRVAAELGITAFDSAATLLDRVKAVSIAAPTVHHYSLVKRCLEAGVHVLVEKPLTHTLAQADELLALQRKTGRVLAVGHLKRFHPAVDLLRGMNPGVPRYFEAERFAPFKPRSLDVDVVVDLMIHDLDLALLFIRDHPANTQAIGASVVTDKVDVAHAWIGFRNRAVASFSASRISETPARRLRLFWNDFHARIDFLENTLILRECSDYGDTVSERHIPFANVDLLQRQIDAFLASTEEGPVFCDGEEGRRALALAVAVGEALAPDSTCVQEKVRTLRRFRPRH